MGKKAGKKTGSTSNAIKTPSSTPTSTPAASTTKTYLVKAGDTGSYADIANKAQAYLTGGTYTPGQTIDTNWWGAGGGKAQMYGNSNTYKGQAMTSTDLAKAYEYANLYDQKQEEQKLAPYLEMQNYYQQILDTQDAQYAANQEAAMQRTAQTIASIRANEDNINNDFEKAQKENYINQIIQKNQMNDYMSAMGYTGGMAESTLQGINNNYATNRQSAISERDNALRQIEQLVAEAQASGNSDLADIANNYYNSYVKALQNQAQMKYQISENQRDQANLDRNYLLQLRQQEMNERAYEDERKSEVAEKLASNDFDAFLNTYKGKYTKEATYRKWIENLKKMSDPYGYNKQKIAYLTQYINSGMGKKKKAGKSTKSTNSGGLENGGSENNSGNYEYVRQNAYTNMYGNSTYGQRVGGQTSAVNYVKSQLQKGLISENEALAILSELGIK
ncbi:putative uncharacterized protein [Firmicutes bacterium CAG:238]|nr:putative uncharacterized protein [Firmicutes bacterium CAG:238]